MTTEISVDYLRSLAGLWHSGQTSPLYAFSSSGTVVPGATMEAERCLEAPDSEGDKESLEALVTFFTEADQRREAYELGEEAAESAATWVCSSETTLKHAQRILTMLNDGDPEVDSYLPESPNLSDEYAGDRTPNSLVEDVTGEYCGNCTEAQYDAICEAFENGVSEAFGPACEAELEKFIS